MCIIQMKFKIISLGVSSLCLLLSIHSHATGLDDYLIQKNLIDQNYKIKDQKKFRHHFSCIK